ncbi:hypothetical protein L0337_43120 [candidate division KSB1 bacterium]|nr:hypothetical protein [candidate division KSB1 bacterium]
MKHSLLFSAVFALTVSLGCEKAKNPTQPEKEQVNQMQEGLHTSQLASGLSITYSTTGFGPVTYFSGEVQESTVTFAGFGPTGTTLEPGAPFVTPTHEASFTVGVNDGTFPGPTETHTIKTIFTISYLRGTKTVTKTVTLEQDATLFQIGNDQFQFDLASSKTKTLHLGPLGFLDITANPATFQLPANSSGAGAILQTRFLFYHVR